MTAVPGILKAKTPAVLVQSPRVPMRCQPGKLAWFCGSGMARSCFPAGPSSASTHGLAVITGRLIHTSTHVPLVPRACWQMSLPAPRFKRKPGFNIGDLKPLTLKQNTDRHDRNRGGLLATCPAPFPLSGPQELGVHSRCNTQCDRCQFSHHPGFPTPKLV